MQKTTSKTMWNDLRQRLEPITASSERSTISDEERVRAKVDGYNAIYEEAKDGINCPYCHNKLWTAVPIFGAGYWTDAVIFCSCNAQRKAKNDRRKSGLNASGRYTLANYQDKEPWQEDIKSSAIAFVDDLEEAPWFFIGGQSGAGKTHITTAIAHECINRGRATKYMVWNEDYKRLKGLAFTDPAKYQEEVQALIAAPILLVDDLFKGGKDEQGKFKPPTEADIKGAFDIINARYNNPRSITIISSERMLADIVDLDEAIGGRIAERAKDYIINIPANSKKNYRIQRTV